MVVGPVTVDVVVNAVVVSVEAVVVVSGGLDAVVAKGVVVWSYIVPTES